MGPLAALWHSSWHEAHAAFLSPAIVARRTTDHFASRLLPGAEALRIAGPEGAPLGLCIIESAHLDQLYVSPEARGTGLASTLLQDAESRLRAAGVTDAKLDCVTQNHRAARFYTRHGWTLLGHAQVPAAAIEPPILIDVLLFGKRLVGPASPTERSPA